MRSSPAVSVGALACLWLSSVASGVARAQVVATTTTTSADVYVEAHVTTTTTTTIASEEVVVVAAPSAPDVAPSADDGLAVALTLRGELLLFAPEYDMAAWGMSALLSLAAADGWSGGLVLGYLGEIGFDGPSEVDVGLEAARDFSPESTLGFVLVARAGSAFVLGELQPFDSGVRLFGQLGIGARISFDPRVAIAFDLRGVVRVRPPSVVTAADVTGGLGVTLGAVIRLD